MKARRGASKVHARVTAGKVDPVLRRAYARLVAVIAKTAREEMKDFDARWEAAAAIVTHEPPLYYAGGCKNAAEFYRTVMHEEPRNAQRYVRVARFASPAEEQRYGISKLDAAIAFVEAKVGHPVAHPPLPIAFDRLRIPVGAKHHELSKATVPQINAAAAALLGKGKKKPRNEVHAAIERELRKVTSMSTVSVKEEGGLLSFRGVPVAALTHFLRALTHANAQRRSD